MAKAMAKMGTVTPAAMAAAGEEVLGELLGVVLEELIGVVLEANVDAGSVVTNTVVEEDAGDARDEDIDVDVG